MLRRVHAKSEPLKNQEIGGRGAKQCLKSPCCMDCALIGVKSF